LNPDIELHIMSRRFTLTQPEKMGKTFFDVAVNPLPPPRFNIAPQQPLNVICQVERRYQMRLMLWGFIPHWTTDLSLAHSLINARSETAHEKPSFRAALRYRRFLIPADGFYEWGTMAAVKQAFYFTKGDRSLFALGGLWDSWNDIETVTILTTDASDLVKPIHPRMPVIISPQYYAQWLNPFSRWQEMRPLMQPDSGDDFQVFPVSSMVNQTEVDRPACIEPIPVRQSKPVD